jgi:tetratricopeptide (TPR) repeat protein
MPKLFIISFILLISASVNGQKHKKQEPVSQSNRDTITANLNSVSQDTLYARMFRNGMRYGDYRLAITALHGLYAIHPDKINYLDSLCLLYGQTQNYSQCLFTGRDVLKYSPDNIPVISAIAVAEQQLGMYKEALEMFQREYSKTSSLYANYQIAVLQYALKKYGEAQATLDRLILNPDANKDKISFAIGNNSSQLVLYKAAAENLMGIIYQDLKDFEKAKASFKKALEIQPDFALAQNNLDYIQKNQQSQQQTKSPASNEKDGKTNKPKKTK